ncbi:MAG: hypothetical protein QG582_473, partial [Candidatus Thermoplasmatota archaeon]|nr:hypothetical protein [Candidatus Thermoplasmatota archaeon]
EEMVDRKINAYAQKKRELDSIEAALTERRENAHGDVGQERKAPDRGDPALARRIRAVHELVAAEGACDDLEPCLASLEGHVRRLVVARSELEQMVAQMQEGETEVKTLLKALDGLLGQLPTGVVDRFSKSEEFKLYERVLDRLNV